MPTVCSSVKVKLSAIILALADFPLSRQDSSRSYGDFEKSRAPLKVGESKEMLNSRLEDGESFSEDSKDFYEIPRYFLP